MYFQGSRILWGVTMPSPRNSVHSYCPAGLLFSSSHCFPLKCQNNTDSFQMTWYKLLILMHIYVFTLQIMVIYQESSCAQSYKVPMLKQPQHPGCSACGNGPTADHNVGSQSGASADQQKQTIIMSTAHCFTKEWAAGGFIAALYSHPKQCSALFNSP